MKNILRKIINDGLSAVKWSVHDNDNVTTAYSVITPDDSIAIVKRTPFIMEVFSEKKNRTYHVRYDDFLLFILNSLSCEQHDVVVKETEDDMPLESIDYAVDGIDLLHEETAPHEKHYDFIECCAKHPFEILSLSHVYHGRKELERAVARL